MRILSGDEPAQARSGPILSRYIAGTVVLTTSINFIVNLLVKERLKDFKSI